MKNFIFAMCGFLMMSLVSLDVQASSVESPKCEYVNPSVDVGLPDIQCITFEASSVDCVVLITPQPIFMVVDSPVKQTVTITAMQRKQIQFLNASSGTSISRSIAHIIAIQHIVH